MTIARILCDNLELDKIQRNPFLLENSKSNPYINCNKVPKMSLKLWKE
jgi:hypothetical protein